MSSHCKDPKSQKIVQQMLSSCFYKVLYKGKVFPALRALWYVKDKMKLCLTNAQRLESVGPNFLRRFEDHFQLPILKMTPDYNILQWKGDDTEAVAYILNDFSYEVIRQVWLREMVDANVVKQDMLKLEMAEKGAVDQKDDDVELDTAIYFAEEEDVHMKESKECRIQEEMQVRKDKEKGGKDAKKSPRVRWTPKKSKMFLDAVDLLGVDRTTPKNILETMDLPGLKLKHVSSHLQKHRKRLKEEELNLQKRHKQRPHAKNPGFDVSASHPGNGSYNHGDIAYPGNGSYNRGNHLEGSNETTVHQVVKDPMLQNQYPSTHAILLQRQHLTDMGSIQIPSGGNSVFVDPNPIQAAEHLPTHESSRLDPGNIASRGITVSGTGNYISGNTFGGVTQSDINPAQPYSDDGNSYFVGPLQGSQYLSDKNSYLNPNSGSTPAHMQVENFRGSQYLSGSIASILESNIGFPGYGNYNRSNTALPETGSYIHGNQFRGNHVNNQGNIALPGTGSHNQGNQFRGNNQNTIPLGTSNQPSDMGSISITRLQSSTQKPSEDGSGFFG